jgi:hypothetical protein
MADIIGPHRRLTAYTTDPGQERIVSSLPPPLLLRCPRIMLQIILIVLAVATLICVLALPIYTFCRVRGWVGGQERSATSRSTTC